MTSVETPEKTAPAAGVAHDADDQFDELARSVAMADDGNPVLALRNVPEGFWGKLVRFGMLLMLTLGSLLIVGYAGFWYYQKTHPFHSQHYDDLRTHMAEQREEASVFEPDPSPYLWIPGAVSLDRTYHPGSEGVTIVEEMQVPRRAEYVADLLIRRWRNIPGMTIIPVSVSRSPELIGMHRDGKMTLRASIEPTGIGHSYVRATMYREPTDLERRSFSLPDDLPKPPPGSGATSTVTGGGGAGSRMGRVHRFVIPGDVGPILSYYKHQFRSMGWELMGKRSAQMGEGVTYIYSKGKMGCSLQATGVNLHKGPHAIIVLVPF